MRLFELIVLALIELQGSDDFRTRESATQWLVAMDKPVLQYLEPGLKHNDIEVVRRSERVRDDIKTKHFGTGLLPWIDMLPTDFPDRQVVIDKYLNMARGGGYYQGQGWPEYRLATMLYFDELFEKGVCFKSLREKMKQEEINYCQKRQMKHAWEEGYGQVEEVNGP